MIELQRDQLVFSFPEVHEDAELRIEFQRTLRIPDDGRTWPLPPGLGRFPPRHVDDFQHSVPPQWVEHGGVMLPMYQAEAMWLNFSSLYPFAVRVLTGLVDAVTGEPHRSGLARRPQNYLVVPGQPWLDGWCVAKGEIRQFVAMPLGQGITAEEQLTGKAEHGGLQLIVHPLKREAWLRLLAQRRDVVYARPAPMVASVASPALGLAPGGRMRQEIYRDPYQFDDWDLSVSSRCFVHLANSQAWRRITGEAPPTTPPSAKQYNDAGLPWFEYYGEGEALEGSKILGGMKSIGQLAQGQVREGVF